MVKKLQNFINFGD